MKPREEHLRFFSRENYSELNLEHSIRFWRKKICDSIFYFLTFFGFFAYIPSLILSLRDNLYFIASIDTIVYALIVFITLNRRISYRGRSLIGSSLFYVLGVILLFALGPVGAGNLWLFAFSLIVGLTLGEKASLLSLAINIATQLAIFALLKTGLIHHQTLTVITADVWLIRAVNFITLNFIIVISNIIFVRGFETLLNRSDETKRATIVGLASLAEHRDSDTGEHLKRIQTYTTIVAEGLSEIKEYRKYITENYISDIAISSILHDIGKVGIQDSILLKPGKLTDEEFGQIKQHTLYGGDVISEIEKNIRGRSIYILAKEIAYYHHEKWDGSGYPEGLSGNDIPLSARIVSLADVYDALTSERPYKKAFSHDRARDIIMEERGKHFDPVIVDVFSRREDLFRSISAIAEKAD